MEEMKLLVMKRSLIEMLSMVNKELLAIHTTNNSEFEKYSELVFGYICDSEEEALSGLSSSKTTLKELLTIKLDIGINKADKIIQYFINKKYITVVKLGRKQMLYKNKEENNELENPDFYSG